MADSVPIDGGSRRNTGWFAGREAVRTPIRFRERVISMFRDPRNIQYLRSLFERNYPRGALRNFAIETLDDAVYSFSTAGEGRAYDILASDPVAQRGAASRSASAWSEVRRLNLAFFQDRLAFLRDQAHIIDRRAPRDGISEDEEPYHIRMFTSDSLRPPGLEHLNTPGPLYALREDQSTWTARHSSPRQRETFSGQRAAPSSVPRGPSPADAFVHGEDDAPWDGGDPNRTPEQAMAEYWGDGWTVSETMTGAPETMGQGYGADYGWGGAWKENGGTRFMRRETIPFWQFGGREGYDYDIEENLGTMARELDGHVRRWDMDRVRNPRGQEYRRYGPRTGHVV